MRNKKRLIVRAVAVCIVVMLIGILTIPVILKKAKTIMYDTCYTPVTGSYMNSFYQGKNVMVIVPHEDDEINVAGGVMENYVAAGSTVRVVFGTNGDAYGGGDRRIQEAITSLGIIGIPEEQVFFLGYGDDWNTEYDHLYNAPGDAPLTSMGGYTKTYGIPSHPDYHTTRFGSPALYTRNNYKMDIESIILDYHPDVIFCVDNDIHPDHKALSLLFEEAMGEILSTKTDYTPVIYKGFGYCTAWEAANDYYAYNIHSTLNPSEHDYMDRRFEYNFSNRVRMPVTTRQLAYTKRASLAYQTLGAHDSQNARSAMDGIVNSDKVFFERNTKGLLYQANIQVSSGEAFRLNDFKLSDTDDIRDKDPDDKNIGTWIPDSSDQEKKVRVSFKQPVSLNRIVLYDHIEPEQNITSGRVVFSDGSAVEVPALNIYGSATEVAFKTKTDITGFTFQILSQDGKYAGLTELEAYAPDSHSFDQENAFIKLTMNDEFVYDTYVNAGEKLEFSLYTYPKGEFNLSKDYRIYLDGQEITEGISENVFTIKAPHKVSMLRIEKKDQKGCFDQIQLKPLKLSDRILIWGCQRVEELRDRKQDK